MIILSPVGIFSLRSDFTQVEGSQHFITSYEANCEKFIRKLRVRPRFITLQQVYEQSTGTSRFQRHRTSASSSLGPLVDEGFASSSLGPLVNKGIYDSPLPSGLEDKSSDLEDLAKKSQNGATASDANSTLKDGTELAALRLDPVRSSLLKKLSEANQYSRFMKREVKVQEGALLACRSQISALEHELGLLVHIAEEIAREGGKKGTRKIKGRYIHSHLACKLQELYQSLQEQKADINDVLTREVEFVWNGMAEDVTVMGSFDDWTQGEPMSPETTGTFTKFSTTLQLRPGRYEIKFRIDGDWRLSPDLPTVGDGLMMNNLLIVK